LIAGHPILNAAGWAAEFGVDARTIQRDVAYLRQSCGLDIVYDEALGGYKCSRPKPFPMRETKAKKWARLMDLIHRIAAEPGRSSQDLATAMGCTPRTIFRDIRELEDLGLPLYSDNGYRFAADAFLPALNLQPKELLSLLLAARMLESVGGHELAPEARRAIEKLLRAMSEERRPDMGALRETVQVSALSEDTGVSQLLELQAVIGNGRQLRLSYLGLQDQTAQERVVDPMGLFGFRQVWYLRAFDHLRQGYRSFRLSRVASWEQLSTPVAHPAKMDLHEAVYHRWDVEGVDLVTVELQVTEPLARWLAENPPHPSQEIDGHRVTYRVSDLSAVSRWAAGLHGLEVVGPPALRAEMAKLAGDLHARYGLS
jgi:predicted DNA-binding transcriptional regulator YafY